MKSSKVTSRNSLLLFLFSSMMATVIGTWGFLEACPDNSFLDAIYHSIQLFTLNFDGGDGPTPWTIEIARWLAPLTLAGGALGATRLFFGERWKRWRAGRMLGHHVICGLGEKGWALARDLLKNRQKVVALDPAPDAEDAAQFCDAGGLLLRIKATSREDLIAANVARAVSLIAVTNKDEDNLALALAAAQLAEEANRKGSALDIYTHIGSVAYRDLLDRNDILEASSQHGSSIRTFNFHANLARMLLRDNPLETAGHPDGATNQERKIHLVLSDLCDTAIALLIHVARAGHYSGGRKVHVHVLTHGARKLLKSLTLRYRALGDCVASLNSIDVDGAEDATDFGDKTAQLIQNSAQDCFTVFPAFSDDRGRIDDILHLHECVPPGTVFRMPIPRGLKRLLDPVLTRKKDLATRLAEFPSPQDCSGYPAVFNDHLDEVAKSIHAVWLSENAEQIGQAEKKAKAQEDLGASATFKEEAGKLRAKATNKPWESLTEAQKDANRSQADHFWVKIRAAGLDPKSTTQDVWRDLCTANPERLELLAEAEHERWVASQRLAGWKKGERDDIKKMHPNLVPYCQLNEETKKFDRDAVKNIADYQLVALPKCN
jgi:TrkA-N domain/RyR domain